MNIVNGNQSGSEHFFYNDQMAQVSAGELRAGVASAIRFDWLRVVGIRSVQKIDATFGGKSSAVPCQPGGKDAIKDIYTAGDAIDQIFGRAHTHQITGFIGGKNLIDDLDHGVHLFFGFTH